MSQKEIKNDSSARLLAIETELKETKELVMILIKNLTKKCIGRVNAHGSYECGPRCISYEGTGRVQYNVR